MQPENNQNQTESNWQYTPSKNSPAPNQQNNPQQLLASDSSDKSQLIEMPDADTQTLVSWTASEFIAYQKDAKWYISAFIVLVVLVGLSYLITSGDLISVFVIMVVSGLFISLASRKPRTLNYAITNKGIQVGEKLYNYSTIRSFSIMEIDNIQFIDLMPLQRFKPALSIFFDPKDETAIVQAIGEYLPKETRKQEAIDKLMHKIRF